MFLAGHPSQGYFGLQSHCAPCYFFTKASFYPSDFSFTPLRHGGTLCSRRAPNLLGRLVEGEKRWEVFDHPQGALPQNWVGTEPNLAVTYMMLKATTNDRRKLLALCHDELHGSRSDIVRLVSLKVQDRYFLAQAKRFPSFSELETVFPKSLFPFDQFLEAFWVQLSGENTKSKKLTDRVEGQQEANVIEVRIRTCYQQVIRKAEWCETMDREINVTIGRKVWDLIEPLESAKVWGNHWVYTLKME
ncbi:hypothetical protein TNCV_951401 [Trichonephila clavipes]|nr:hypothetical protein TNCV_951401 [Trichonephila clavipes]